MKNSLPKNWEIKSLKSLMDVQNGYAFNSKQFNEINGFPIIRIRDIKNGKTETLFSGSFKNEFIVRRGDFLIGMDGEFRCYEWKSNDALLNQRVCRLINFSDMIDKKFIFWGINKYLKEIEDTTSFVTVKHISSNQIKNIEIPLPPITEQKQIVALLEKSISKINQAITLVIENIEKIKQLDESAFSQVFEKLLSDNVTKKKLVDIADVKRGKSKHRPRNDKRLYDGDYPLIQTGDIRNAGKFITQFSQTYNETGLAQSKLWEKGTVCLTIAANIGDVAILGIDACFPDSVVGIHSKTEDNIYIYYFLKSIKKQLDEKSSASAQKNLSVEKLSDFYIPIPSLAKQQQIVSHLDQLTENNNKLLQHYQNKLQALQRLKNSVLESAFKGEFKKEQKAKTFNLAFYQMQLIGLSIEANKYDNIPQGEMAIAKDMYLLDRLFQVPTKMNFANHNLGPFAPEIKKGITNKTHFDKKNFPNSQATYVVTKNEEELFKTVSADLKSQVFNGISELNRKLFSKISPYKRAEAKELFATVLKCIEDTQSTDLPTIREAMKNWKIKIGQFKTKFDKFPEPNTKLVIKFIVKENWHLKVLGK